ncbi:proton-conducting transporter membrane subunit [Cytophaga aurantiaca]|uniref:proton-conducting transporter transmembrane domain-containing protein n=1 Tax=Cytophaga aurantiaca TaxID=29530 RepID=UPI00035D5664|nr:proton-conducting transporter membrane subunit [Cytophaga aurantiaca]
MTEQYLALISLIAPLTFVVTAIVSWFQPGMRPEFMKGISTLTTGVSIIVAAVCAYLVFINGLLETSLLGMNQLGFSIRLDTLSVLMLSMISLISFIVVKFSLNYLDGDKRQGIFIGRLAATIASVQLLVLSGNLALLFASWVLTSVSLHRLLVFYSERPGAIVVARKKFIVARLGDGCLLGAIIVLYSIFKTGNLEVIFQSIKLSMDLGIGIVNIEYAAILLVFAALLKSAQFPTHGWLIEVMETPTPVSALLHAGLLNAGPFLIVRMAYIMEVSMYSSYILIIVGGFTALFASVVFLTQTSLKTALGYSSVAHMGFSLLVCGLGLYPAAMLHLVAHSFYKAHAFLSSGSLIEVIRTSPILQPKRTGNPFNIVLGIVLAICVYIIFALLWGIDFENQLSLLAIGAIIVMGLSTLFASALDSNGSYKLILKTSLLAIVVVALFFTLESGMHYLLHSGLPQLRILSTGEMILVCLITIIFSAAVFLQIYSPLTSSSLFSKSIILHLRNGLYANTLFDRLVGSLKIHLQPQHIEISDNNKIANKGQSVEV